MVLRTANIVVTFARLTNSRRSFPLILFETNHSTQLFSVVDFKVKTKTKTKKQKKKKRENVIQRLFGSICSMVHYVSTYFCTRLIIYFRLLFIIIYDHLYFRFRFSWMYASEITTQATLYVQLNMMCNFCNFPPERWIISDISSEAAFKNPHLDV